VTTVREITHDLLRTWGLTTVFGNPGSNELPFLEGIPACSAELVGRTPKELRYVLGLHEGAVLAMADGYAQATGRPAFVNLHSAAGLGNAMGNLTNARAAHTPLVVTAGQQSRAMVGLGAVLAEPDLTRVPEPHVKWSFEPVRPQDVPRALSEAFHLAALPPAGPVFVSLPLDDWTQTDFAGMTAFFYQARSEVRGGGGMEGQVGVIVDDAARGEPGLISAEKAAKKPEEPKSGKTPGPPKQTLGPRYKSTGEGVGPNESRRAAFARLLTADRQFARAAVNRHWGLLIGRGLLHPLDGFTAGRKPSRCSRKG